MCPYSEPEARAIGRELREVTDKYLAVEHNAHLETTMRPLLDEAYRQWVRMMSDLRFVEGVSSDDLDAWTAAYPTIYDMATLYAGRSAARAAVRDFGSVKEAANAQALDEAWSDGWFAFWATLPLDQWLAYARDDRAAQPQPNHANEQS